MVCKAQNTNRIFKTFFSAEIDINAIQMLILNHLLKILDVYSSYFISLTRIIFRLRFLFSSVILCSAFSVQKKPPPRRGSSYRPGKGCSFLSFTALRLSLPESADAAPAADGQAPLPAGLPQGSAREPHGTAGPLQTAPPRPARSRSSERCQDQCPAAGRQG